MGDGNNVMNVGKRYVYTTAPTTTNLTQSGTVYLKDGDGYDKLNL